jgi:hypothetical protein
MSELGQDLQCQSCPKKYLWRVDDATTANAARFADWRVYEGPTIGGGYVTVILCADCGGPIRRPRVPKSQPLDGQQSFDFDCL